MFEPIADFYKSVWFDLGAIKQNKSDAKWGIKLKELPASTYDKKFPEGSGVSIGDNLNDNTTSQHTKYDSVTVGLGLAIHIHM